MAFARIHNRIWLMLTKCPIQKVQGGVSGLIIQLAKK